MRLIDADKLKNYLWSEPLYTDSINDRTDIREHIDQMPTVDAIPVEFIEKKMVEIDMIFLKILDRLEGPGAYQKLLTEYNALRDLIRAWKERQDDEAH